MCDKITGTAVADHDITVFKLVTIGPDGSFRSQYLPSQRNNLPGVTGKGPVLVYTPGSRTHGWPMVHATAWLPGLIRTPGREEILECVIPKGTRYMIGKGRVSGRNYLVYIPEFIDVLGGSPK